MFDKNKFAQILKEISGTYDNQRDFSQKSGINRTYLSQYINMKIAKPPKPEILERLSEASNGVTSYRELMSICGYIDIPYSAGFEFASDNDKMCIEKAINHAISNNLHPNEIPNNPEIISILNNVGNMPFNTALDIVVKEVFKEASILGININSCNLKKTSFNSNSAIVFVYGTIPAGVPMECIEDIIDTEEISADMLKGDKQYFGLEIKGDSMFPDYLDGDTLILEKVDNCESGQDCVVMVNGNDGTFKRVFKNEQGIILQPLNNNYQPMIYSNEQIEKLPVKIIGRVVELRRKK